MVEKPAVVSREQAASVRQLLADRAATILVDHVHLYDQAFRVLRDELATLGPVRAIQSSAGNFGPYRKDVSVLWDWAPHDIAMCLAVCPGPLRPVSASRGRSRWIDGALAEELTLKLDAAGVELKIHLSTLEPKHRWFALQLDSCTLVYRDAGARTLVRFLPDEDFRSTGQTIFTSSELPLKRAITEFTEAIRSGVKSRKSIDLGLSVVELIADLDALIG
jgi:predicted dehydrogenase